MLLCGLCCVLALPNPARHRDGFALKPLLGKPIHVVKKQFGAPISVTNGGSLYYFKGPNKTIRRVIVSNSSFYPAELVFEFDPRFVKDWRSGLRALGFGANSGFQRISRSQLTSERLPDIALMWNYSNFDARSPSLLVVVGPTYFAKSFERGEYPLDNPKW